MRKVGVLLLSDMTCKISLVLQFASISFYFQCEELTSVAPMERPTSTPRSQSARTQRESDAAQSRATPLSDVERLKRFTSVHNRISVRHDGQQLTVPVLWKLRRMRLF